MLTIESLNLQYVTNDAGQRSAVIVPLDQFYQLLEDIADLAVVAERREEYSITHEQVKETLRRDGLLHDQMERVGDKGTPRTS